MRVTPPPSNSTSVCLLAHNICFSVMLTPELLAPLHFVVSTLARPGDHRELTTSVRF